ncbi:MAG: DUF5808 domain-containing protein [Ignavibacteriaceae bacterium]
MMEIGYYIIIGIILLAILNIILDIINPIIAKERRNRVTNESDLWIWGIFYYNPDDPRIIVPKKIKGLGWTFNFAKPISIIIVCVILVFIILSMIYKYSK